MRIIFDIIIKILEKYRNKKTIISKRFIPPVGIVEYGEKVIFKNNG